MMSLPHSTSSLMCSEKQGSVSAQSHSKDPKCSPRSMHITALCLHLPVFPSAGSFSTCHTSTKVSTVTSFLSHRNWHLAAPRLLTGNKSPQRQERLLPALALMLTLRDGDCKPRVGAGIVAIFSGTTWSISHLGDPLDRRGEEEEDGCWDTHSAALLT